VTFIRRSVAAVATVLVSVALLTGGSAAARPLAAAATSDPKVAMIAPPFTRVGAPTAFKAVVTNGGPDAAPNVELRAAVPPGATFISASSTVGTCTGTSPVVCTIGTLAYLASATVTITLSTPAAGSLSLTATVQGDFDSDASNNTASASTPVLEQNAVPPAPPASSAPGTFNAVGTGSISVNGAAKPGDQQFVLNTGDVVNVAGGIITFTDSDGISGSWAKVRFTVARRTNHVIAPSLGIARSADAASSQFRVQQAASGGLTTLTLVGGDFSACSRSLAATSKKPVRQLWGSAKGVFRTSGRFASASVRGTFWLTLDRCDGTLTQVVEGTVDVFDSTRNKTVTLRAGQSYLAVPRSPLKAPRQTSAQVAKRGLVYGGRTYTTKKAFEAYLKGAGWTWRDFVKRYPALAAALARRY
jgi:uncharacterized repeat protein (TIGR01451 family)